jgi:hypothetical protein
MLVALAACSPEVITSSALDQSAPPGAGVERADTGQIAREKWLLRLAGQEAATAGPNRWFSLQPGSAQTLRASRSLLTAPKGATAILSDGDTPPYVLEGATSVSIAASNIMVLTMFSIRAYELSGDGAYDVYFNGRAYGSVPYETYAYNAALYSQSVKMSISGSATDTIDVVAKTLHKVRHEELRTMGDSYYNNVVSIGHDSYAPPLPPPPPVEYQLPGNGPDGAPDGEVGCWFHYRSYDGGRTWYLLRVSCPDVAGKYKGLAPSGALRSVSTTGVRWGGTTTSSSQPVTPATFVVLGQDSLQDGQRAVVYLRPGMSPEAVVAIDRKNARPSDIAEGVAAMMTMRAEAAPGEEGSFYRTTVMQTAKSRPALSASGQSRFAGYLVAMKHAPLVNVPGVGSGNAVEVQMPTGH